MIYTVELKNEHALRSLGELEQLGVLTIQVQAPVSQTKRKINFDLIQLDTRGFKFNREEANER
ncbi:MAG: hypothetical protein H7Z21_01110 [Hymenobacter sp.]|nr:hypothetical protein [Hymenobacter sp.]